MRGDRRGLYPVPPITPWMPNWGVAVGEAQLRQGEPCNAVEGTQPKLGQTSPAALPAGAAVP